MVTATCKGTTYRVDGLANRGQWFGKTWLVGIGCGFDCHMIVVEADNEGEAIDALTDSSYGHLIKVEPEDVLSDDWQTYAGNCSEPVNLDEIRILAKCKVNYFAKKDSI